VLKKSLNALQGQVDQLPRSLDDVTYGRCVGASASIEVCSGIRPLLATSCRLNAYTAL